MNIRLFYLSFYVIALCMLHDTSADQQQTTWGYSDSSCTIEHAISVTSTKAVECSPSNCSLDTQKGGYYYETTCSDTLMLPTYPAHFAASITSDKACSINRTLYAGLPNSCLSFVGSIIFSDCASNRSFNQALYTDFLCKDLLMNVPLSEGQCTDIKYEVFTGVCPAAVSSPIDQPLFSAPTNQPVSSTPSARPLGSSTPSNEPASNGGPVGDINPIGLSPPESNPPQTLTSPDRNKSKVSMAASHYCTIAFMFFIVHLLY